MPEARKPIWTTCKACRDRVEISSYLRLGDGHTDTCRARPVLMRLDSTSDGKWLPIVHSPENLTALDRSRIRCEILELIEAFRKERG